MSPLQHAKLWLVDHTGLAKDALHIYVGLLVFFGAALLMRRSVGDWRPWTAVFVVAALGEAWDIIDRWRDGIPIDLPGDWHDIWNTLFWPTAILLLARFTPLFERRR